MYFYSQYKITYPHYFGDFLPPEPSDPHYELDFIYEELADSYKIIGLSDIGKTKKKLVVPSLYNDLPVVELGDYCIKDSIATDFSFADESNILQIGRNVFENSNISKVVLPFSLLKCDNRFLSDSKVEYLTINSNFSLTTHSRNDNTYLKGLKFSGNSTNVAIRMFENFTALEYVELNEHMTEIGQRAFSGCSNLKNINLPSSLTKVGNSFISGTNIEELVINSNINCGSPTLTHIAETSSVKKIIFSDNVSIVGEYMFAKYTGLNEVVFGNNIVEIKSLAFYNCNSLSSFELPEGLKTIGNRVFEGCSSLNTINLPSSLTKVGSNFITGTNIEELVINSNIDGGSPTLSLLKETTSVKKITFGNNVSKIGNYLFAKYTGLIQVTFNNSVTEIGTGAFTVCNSLTSFDFPEGLVTIGVRAFDNCNSIVDIRFPSTLKYIKDSAFKTLNSLERVYYNGTSTEWNNVNIGSGNDALNNAALIFKDA